MDNYLLERMVEHKQSELNRARGKRDWLAILRRAR